MLPTIYSVVSPPHTRSAIVALGLERVSSRDSERLVDVNASKKQNADGSAYHTRVVNIAQCDTVNGKLQAKDLPPAIRFLPKEDLFFAAALEGRVDKALQLTFHDLDLDSEKIEVWVAKDGIDRRIALVIAGACISDSADLMRGLLAEIPPFVVAPLLAREIKDFKYADEMLGCTNWKSSQRPTPTALHIAAMAGNAAPLRCLLKSIFEYDQQLHDLATTPFFMSNLYALLFHVNIADGMNVMKCIVATGQAIPLRWVLQMVREFNNGRNVEQIRDQLLRYCVEVDATDALYVVLNEGELTPSRLTQLLHGAGPRTKAILLALREQNRLTAPAHR